MNNDKKMGKTLITIPTYVSWCGTDSIHLMAAIEPTN